jgi:DNA-binding LacI/PurR family transcriptional regulator
MKKKQTLRDIAHLAGVSHTTVSRVLDKDPRVRPETAQKVLARYTETVIEAGVDGLILASVTLKDPIIEGLIKETFPLVMVNRRLKAEMGEYMVLDNCKGAFQLTVLDPKLIIRGSSRVVIDRS